MGNEKESQFPSLAPQSTLGTSRCAPSPHAVIRPKPSPPLSIQNKLKSFFEDEIWKDSAMIDALVQFWTPVKTIKGHTLLNVSDESLCSHISYPSYPCSADLYRNHTIHYEYWVEDDESQLGPVGRAFTQHSSEYCPNILYYSKQVFPLRDLAKQYGICQYLALPLSELNEEQQCIGVLECVTEVSSLLYSLPFDRILNALKRAGLACLGSHLDKRNNCNSRIRKFVSQMCMADGLKFVGRIHRLPLIQVWVPCTCGIPGAFAEGDESRFNFSNAESRISKLFPHLTFLRWDMHTAYYFEGFNQITSCSTYLVTNEKGLVGKAHESQKCCFLSITDYPLVHLIRSSGLAASFAAPLQVINSELPPLILEVFLPSQPNCDEISCQFFHPPRDLLVISCSDLWDIY